MLAAVADTHALIWYLYDDSRLSAYVRGFMIDTANRSGQIALDLPIVRTLSRVSAAQVPDMPDRIIAATAPHLGVPLISRDRQITLSSVQTIW